MADDDPTHEIQVHVDSNYHQDIPDIYSSESSSWDLSSSQIIHDAQEEYQEHHTAALVGKIMFAVVGFFIHILVFVAARNNWNLSFSKLPQQITEAFTGEGSKHPTVD